MIGLISCCGPKLDRVSIARRLYTSPLFQKSLAYAERRCMHVYVLSALYGLVEIEQMLKPYNQRLGRKKERELWAHQTVAALRGRHRPDEELLLLAGADYADPLKAKLDRVGWTGAIHEPLAGMQVGERLAWLNAELDKMPLQLPAAGQEPVSRATALWLTPRPESKSPYACAFCGKSEKQAKRMIAGPTPRAFICDECVELCVDILDSQREVA